MVTSAPNTSFSLFAMLWRWKAGGCANLLIRTPLECIVITESKNQAQKRTTTPKKPHRKSAARNCSANFDWQRRIPTHQSQTLLINLLNGEQTSRRILVPPGRRELSMQSMPFTRLCTLAVGSDDRASRT